MLPREVAPPEQNAIVMAPGDMGTSLGTAGSRAGVGETWPWGGTGGAQLVPRGLGAPQTWQKGKVAQKGTSPQPEPPPVCAVTPECAGGTQNVGHPRVWALHCPLGHSLCLLVVSLSLPLSPTPSHLPTPQLTVSPRVPHLLPRSVSRVSHIPSRIPACPGPACPAPGPPGGGRLRGGGGRSSGLGAASLDKRRGATGPGRWNV